MAKNKTVIAAIDIGSSRISCLVASVDKKNKINIEAFQTHKKEGFYAGQVTDVAMAEKSILEVINQCEKKASLNINKAIVSVCGKRLSANSTKAEIKIKKSIKNYDIIRLADEVKIKYIKNGREPIHIIPLRFLIDNINEVKNPLRMRAAKLLIDFRVISFPENLLNNISERFKKCQIKINKYIVDVYASAISCIDKIENKLGAIVIDIGGAITSFCIIKESKLIYCDCISIGGERITKDISSVFNIDFDLAEKIKILNANLSLKGKNNDELITENIKEMYQNELIGIKRSSLNKIISFRTEEIINLIKDSLSKKGFDASNKINNIIITGGSANIKGIDSMIATKLNSKRVRIGYPTNLQNIIETTLYNPANCCLAGMLLLNIKELQKNLVYDFKNRSKLSIFFIKILSWIAGR